MSAMLILYNTRIEQAQTMCTQQLTRSVMQCFNESLEVMICVKSLCICFMNACSKQGRSFEVILRGMDGAWLSKLDCSRIGSHVSVGFGATVGRSVGCVVGS